MNSKETFSISRFAEQSVPRKILRVFLAAIALLIVSGLLFVVVQIVRAPSLSEISAAPEGYLTVILDENGEELSTLHAAESNRIYVPLSDTPAHLQNAFIAIEDSRFRSHHGIDMKGIGRALFRGLKSGGFSEGASTITQQLIKNNVLTGWTEEKTFLDKLSRKIQEQYLALALESKYSKDWILENYMNTINLGGGTRGVQVASRYYFGKDAAELTAAEAALIAGITKNPSGYNPFKHPEESLNRQRLVLAAMLREGYLTQEEYDAALAEDVLGALTTESSDTGRVFDWFEDELLGSLVRDLGEQYQMSESDAWNLLYSGGLTIYSTENVSLQRLCEDTVLNGGYLRNGEEVSVVITDVESGAVRAIVGGSEEKESNLIYNRAVDAVRQPGSTIKIIGQYAAALDRGQLTLGTVMCDEPYSYSDGTALHNASGSYDGMITVEQAISDSSNIVALKSFRLAGKDTVASYLRRFGITTLDENDYTESLAIGGTYHGVTNLELTAAYNAIAAGGSYVKPYYYTKVLNHDGAVILQNTAAGSAAVKASTADLLTLAMEKVMTEGTGVSANISAAEAAGKSGTTNDRRDLWFMGFTSRYTCGVWGGFDDNSAQENGSYVKSIWRQIMNGANSGGAESLVDTRSYDEELICTKCGNLARTGLCDDTLQGDMTASVYYLPGTAPRDYCDCHIRLTICSESGKEAGFWCPTRCRESGVRLNTGTPGTADEEFSAESILDTECDVHTNIIDRITDMKNRHGNDSAPGREDSSPPDDAYGQEPYGDPYDDGGMFDDFWGLFGGFAG